MYRGYRVYKGCIGFIYRVYRLGAAIVERCSTPKRDRAFFGLGLGMLTGA